MKALVFSNIWVAFCAASFSLIASSFFHQPTVFYLLFGGTLFLYCFHRVYKYYVLNLVTGQEKEKWMHRNRTLYFLLMIAGLILTIFEFVRLEVFRSEFIISGMLAALVSLLYVVRVRTKNLREVPYTKILWVTLTYVAFTSVLGFHQVVHSDLISNAGFYESLWLIVLGITLMFDVRDMGVDDVRQKTWPQILGYRKSRRLAFTLYLIGLLALGWFTQAHWLFLLTGITVGVGVFFYVHKRPSELNYSLYFEGVLALIGWLFYFIR